MSLNHYPFSVTCLLLFAFQSDTVFLSAAKRLILFEMRPLLGIFVAFYLVFLRLFIQTIASVCQTSHQFHPFLFTQAFQHFKQGFLIYMRSNAFGLLIEQIVKSGKDKIPTSKEDILTCPSKIYFDGQIRYLTLPSQYIFL